MDSVKRPVFVRPVGLLLVAALLAFCASGCGKSRSDDRTVTEKLMNDYMTALCAYNIKNMNRSSLTAFDQYGDSDAVIASCRELASHITWEIEDISISGNTAIAQVTLTQPIDYEAICSEALDEAMRQIGKSEEPRSAELLADAIRLAARKSDAVQTPVEIPLSKVDNQWRVAKTHAVDSILSNIRTSVAAVYAYLDM